MKLKQIFTLLLLLVIGGCLMAQESELNVKSGLRFGYQDSKSIRNGVDYKDNYLSGYIGYFMMKELTHKIAIGTCFEYNISGWKDKSDDKKYERENICIPLFVNLNIGRHLYVHSGVSANFLLGETFTVRNYEMAVPDKYKTHLVSTLAFAGAGIKIFMVSLEARYYLGLNNISTSRDFNVKEAYLQIGARFNFKNNF